MERVRRLRKEVNFKQRDLAILVGKNHQNFANMEKGNLITKDIKETEELAIKILKPLLAKKLIAAQEEVERLEALLITYK